VIPLVSKGRYLTIRPLQIKNPALRLLETGLKSGEVIQLFYELPYGSFVTQPLSP
jgi:hypothetical protein